MPLGVRSRLFLVSFALVLVASLSSAVFLERSLKPVLESRIEGELQRHARTVRETLAVWGGNQKIDEVDPLVDRLGQAVGARVTLIREDGTVLGDSEIPTGEVASIPNHATRPEVLAALADGAGSSRRYSTTIATDMLFFAVRYDLPGGSGVARVALPLNDVDSVMRQLRLFVVLAGLVGLAAATLISLMAAQLLSRRFRSLAQKARSLARGERAPADLRATDEIGHLEGSFDRISLDLDQALTELAGERDRFHTVLEAMGDAVLTVDRDRRIVLANSMAMEFLGLRVAPVGKSLREIIRAPELDEVLCRGALDTTVSLEFELPGSRRVLTRVTSLRVGEGKVIVLSDVTEMRRLETIRRDFVANVSHELRTPISVILANSETLADGGVEDPAIASRFLSAIHANALRLTRLIADLLDLSKIEAGRYPIRAQRMELQPALAAVFESVARPSGEKDQTVRAKGTEGVMVVADPAALEQVLMNLLENAVKYTPDGGRITVGARVTGDIVRVEVRDDGPGIEPWHRERLFERFYRVDPGRSRELGGTGLGLAIVKHLVEKMGGHVGVDAVEPHGSCFWFTVPGTPAADEVSTD